MNKRLLTVEEMKMVWLEAEHSMCGLPVPTVEGLSKANYDEIDETHDKFLAQAQDAKTLKTVGEWLGKTLYHYAEGEHQDHLVFQNWDDVVALKEGRMPE